MNDILFFILAFLPIVWLIVSLAILKIKTHITCPITAVLTIILAVVFWDMKPYDAFTALLEGFALALWPILWTVITAVFTYKLTLESGSMDKINKLLTGVSSDRRILVLLLAWGFGGFMESIAGYGTAVVIPASILVTLGFEPIFAAVLCLVANSAPTAFGALGIPVITLANITDMSVFVIGNYINWQLLIIILLVPFILLFMVEKEKIKALKEVGVVALAAGLGYAIPQFFVMSYIGPELVAVVGSIVSITLIVILAKLRKDKKVKKDNTLSLIDILKATSTYILIFVFIILLSLLDLHLDSSVVIYSGDGAVPFEFHWLTAPGTVIFIAAIIGAKIQGLRFKRIFYIFTNNIYGLKFSILSVLCIVGFSKVLIYSGMINNISTAIVMATGMYYTLIAPVIGTLGTFLTGSDSSSNVLFGVLQRQIGEQLGVNAAWLAAANTSGAICGKIISPQSIAVAAASLGLTGKESVILNTVFKYCLFFVAIVGIVVFVFSKFL